MSFQCSLQSFKSLFASSVYKPVLTVTQPIAVTWNVPIFLATLSLHLAAIHYLTQGSSHNSGPGTLVATSQKTCVYGSCPTINN
jgi:hypothetical protein